LILFLRESQLTRTIEGLLREYPHSQPRAPRETMSKDIRIENPVSGRGFTSKNRAKRFVAQGRAAWVQAEVSIRFVQSDHRHVSAQTAANHTRWWYDRAAHEGMAQIADLANTPVIQPARLLGIGRRKGASRHTFLATQGL
jgi:hypothetical protein